MSAYRKSVTYSEMFLGNMIPHRIQDIFLYDGTYGSSVRRARQGTTNIISSDTPSITIRKEDQFNLVDLPGRHLRALLDLLTPTWHGEEVRLDGYRSLGEPDLVHPLFIDENWDFGRSDNRLDIYEPRLTYIRKLIKSLLSLVEFEYHNEPIRMDGFRLKKPVQWLRPGGGASDILAQAATRWGVRCRFCL